MPRQTKTMFSCLTTLLFFLAVYFVTSAALCAQIGLDPLSDQVAQGIAHEKESSVFPKVVVVDFPDRETGIDSLGAYLADELSMRLEKQLPSGTIIPRKRLVDFLESRRLSPLDLQSVFIAYWAADSIGANEILYGESSPSDSAVSLNLKLLRIGTAKEAANWQVALPVTEEILARRGKALELPDVPGTFKLALRCTSGNSLATSRAFVKSGGTLPKMIHLPNPPYSEQARKEKLSGKRQYDVVIDETGRVALAIPHHPLKPEFDDIALQTMKSWRAEPATKDGKPVAVCTVVEINWKLYPPN